MESTNENSQALLLIDMDENGEFLMMIHCNYYCHIDILNQALHRQQSALHCP